MQLNTRSVAQQLALSQPILAPRVADKSLKIVPTVYEMESGRVHLIPYVNHKTQRYRVKSQASQDRNH